PPRLRPTGAIGALLLGERERGSSGGAVLERGARVQLAPQGVGCGRGPDGRERDEPRRRRATRSGDLASGQRQARRAVHGGRAGRGQADGWRRAADESRPRTAQGATASLVTLAATQYDDGERHRLAQVNVSRLTTLRQLR